MLSHDLNNRRSARTLQSCPQGSSTNRRWALRRCHKHQPRLSSHRKSRFSTNSIMWARISRVSPQATWMSKDRLKHRESWNHRKSSCSRNSIFPRSRCRSSMMTSRRTLSSSSRKWCIVTERSWTGLRRGSLRRTQRLTVWRSSLAYSRCRWISWWGNSRISRWLGRRKRNSIRNRKLWKTCTSKGIPSWLRLIKLILT